MKPEVIEFSPSEGVVHVIVTIPDGWNLTKTDISNTALVFDPDTGNILFDTGHDGGQSMRLTLEHQSV